MTPKLVEIHHFSDNQPELLNPRRFTRVVENSRYSAHPDQYTGTWVYFARNDRLLIRETQAEIRRLLR